MLSQIIPPNAAPAPRPSQRGKLSTGCIVGLVIGIPLVVILGIGLLVSIAAPAVFYKTNLAAAEKTQAAMRDVQVAIKNYMLQYARPPIATGQVILTQGPLLDILQGFDKKLNPREITYLVLPLAVDGSPGLWRGPVADALVDPWGKPLRIQIAEPNAAELPDPEHASQLIKATMLLWSAGPDGDFDTWADNVASWK